MSYFIKLLKLDGKLLEKQKRLQKIKINKNNQYLNLKLSQHNQRSVLSLKNTGLKINSKQEKIGLPHAVSEIHYW